MAASQAQTAASNSACAGVRLAHRLWAEPSLRDTALQALGSHLPAEMSEDSPSSAGSSSWSPLHCLSVLSAPASHPPAVPSCPRLAVADRGSEAPQGQSSVTPSIQGQP